MGTAWLAIAFLSGGAGLDGWLVLDMARRAVLPILLVTGASWWLLAERTSAQTLAALLPAVAGIVWFVIWPWLDVWGQAAATVPSVLSYTGSVIDETNLPWYATDPGQWGGLALCAVATVAGWAWGRD
ncbi:hypothetical protein [Azospirillum palustre]|uniref:hypothetical protein n=1 Tax=Azospirillum palustre TaxID=2044885 RepID=UPI0011780A50|nr:hypothetical protein [Azospirillum palustre]